MTDASASSVWDAIYLPFGAVSSITGTASLDARLPGQWFQLETGLAYNWNRHYDATMGRYLTADPLGFVDGPSVYAYAKNSPAMVADPNGLQGWEEGAAVGCVANPACAAAVAAGAYAMGKAIANTAQSIYNICSRALTMEPPGDCRHGEHRRLQDEVDRSCSGAPRACNSYTSAADLPVFRVRNLTCALARNKINNKCFAGGDPTHRNEADKAFNAVANCENLMSRVP
ncbi:RHS repeat-associated core domain-containing protein [Rhizobiales bacterium GAS113]|nr:RHS repeat-associated core domain-containing protein [Rhizobiales bacterium GAS113]